MLTVTARGTALRPLQRARRAKGEGAAGLTRTAPSCASPVLFRQDPIDYVLDQVIREI